VSLSSFPILSSFPLLVPFSENRDIIIPFMKFSTLRKAAIKGCGLYFQIIKR
jgi:hypothetical protein